MRENHADREQGREAAENQHRLAELIEGMRERNKAGEPLDGRRGLIRRLEEVNDGENRGAQKVRGPRSHGPE